MYYYCYYYYYYLLLVDVTAEGRPVTSNNSAHLADPLHAPVLRRIFSSHSRGTYLSNTTCIPHAFFKRGESCSELNEPYRTSKAVENTRGRTRQVALDK